MKPRANNNKKNWENCQRIEKKLCKKVKVKICIFSASRCSPVARKGGRTECKRAQGCWVAQ